MDRRTFLTGLGAVAATAALPVATAATAEAIDWQSMANLISSDWLVNRAIRNDGILFAGDSISMETGKALCASLGSLGYYVAVNWWNGRPTGPAVDWLEQVAATYGLPPRLLLATGSNDIFDPGQLPAQVARVRDLATAHGSHVYWVDAHVERWRYTTATRLSDLRRTGLVNSYLRQGAWDGLTIIGWSEFLARKEPYRINAYLRDGVHTTDRGAAARNALIMEAMA